MNLHRLRIAMAVLSMPLIAATTLAETTAEVATDVDPSGTWRWESDNNGATVKHELRIDKNDKGEVSAVYDGMLDDLKSVSGSIDGDKLTLDFEVETTRRNFDAQYEVTIDGDKAEGTLTLSSDEGKMDLPWSAKRSVELSDVVGKWNLLVETDEGPEEATLTVQEQDGK